MTGKCVAFFEKNMSMHLVAGSKRETCNTCLIGFMMLSTPPTASGAGGGLARSVTAEHHSKQTHTHKRVSRTRFGAAN